MWYKGDLVYIPADTFFMPNSSTEFRWNMEKSLLPCLGVVLDAAVFDPLYDQIVGSRNGVFEVYIQNIGKRFIANQDMYQPRGKK